MWSKIYPVNHLNQHHRGIWKVHMRDKWEEVISDKQITTLPARSSTESKPPRIFPIWGPQHAITSNPSSSDNTKGIEKSNQLPNREEILIFFRRETNPPETPHSQSQNQTMGFRLFFAVKKENTSGMWLCTNYPERNPNQL